MYESSATKFDVVSAEIERRIKDKVYVSSQKLPSDYDLAKEFNCSRLTIRKAIDELIKKNILVKQPGKGTYVMSQQKIQSGRMGLQGFTEAAKFYGKKSTTKVISFEKISDPSKKVLEELKLSSSDDVFELVRLRSLDDEPMTVEKIYLGKKYIDGLTKEDFNGSLFEQIEKKVEIAYSHQEVAAILVDEETSNLLDVPIGGPLLEVHSVTYSIDGTPILYDVSAYRADRYTFKNTLTRYNN